MTFAGLVKMKCGVVFTTVSATSYFALNSTSMVNTGITGTVALIYSIALAMLVCIGIHDKVVNRAALEEMKKQEGK